MELGGLGCWPTPFLVIWANTKTGHIFKSHFCILKQPTASKGYIFNIPSTLNIYFLGYPQNHSFKDKIDIISVLNKIKILEDMPFQDPLQVVAFLLKLMCELYLLVSLFCRLLDLSFLNSEITHGKYVYTQAGFSSILTSCFSCRSNCCWSLVSWRWAPRSTFCWPFIWSLVLTGAACFLPSGILNIHLCTIQPGTPLDSPAQPYMINT